MAQKVRVRFAPSPTGGLHLGGVRTVLYNYLFARKYGGDFIVRIEDTDQSRFVEGAEQYIFDCLEWCGLEPDESVLHGGMHIPYRQSERKELYKAYAEQLVKEGQAYYAFDTPEELEAMREKLKATGHHNLQYGHHVRMEMKNSLSLPLNETKQLLEKGIPHVIRIMINPGEIITLTDMIRGELSFDTSNIDDKVLLKADGMPTYHLAVVVDDYKMKISHTFRGEEWLPSAPVHLLLWKYLFGLDQMPEWAHLPLILKPDGNGKLSKRDGDRLGFPVFAMNWKDPLSGELTKGFKEMGFLPEAFINMLAVLGWNDGTEQEIFSMDELIGKFSMDRVHKAPAKFDFEKAKWYNHEWIKRLPVARYSYIVKENFRLKGIVIDDDVYFHTVLDLVKDRCTLLTDFYDNAWYFFKKPAEYDTVSMKGKWNEEKKIFFSEFSKIINELPEWSALSLENKFKELAAAIKIKPGELLMLCRIILVGSKVGPAVFNIAATLGKKETISRINQFIATNINL